MLDFIFITGASGIGKTTLAKALFERYNGAYIEQNMMPEFGIPEGVDVGLFEERVCWEGFVTILKKYREMGLGYIIGVDFDDLRTADIPVEFYGYRYITLRLVCRDGEQLERQMRGRRGGLVDFELQRKMSYKINRRPLLPNEVIIDVTGRQPHEVFSEAVGVIDGHAPLTAYDYERPPRELFYSWVYKNGLR